MAKTLKNLIESYQKGELSTPNIQIIDKRFSDEMINLPNDVLLDLTFSRAFFEKSRLTNIRFCNGSFGFGTLIDSKFSNSKKSIEFKGEVYFLDIFNQINELYLE